MERTILIIYEHFGAANAHLATGVWSGIFEDTKEGYDYNSKSALIESCKKDGYKYKVIRKHRNGKISIVKQG